MKIKFLLILCFIIFLIGCYSQEFGSLEFSDSAKEELRQLLQKSLSIDNFDIIYNFQMNILAQNLANITFRQIKQGNKQRQDSIGHMFGFNLSVSSFIEWGQQVTCAVFDNEWKCGYGDEVCIEKDNLKECQSISQENMPPKIESEMLAEAKVAKTEQKEVLGMQVQCYKLLTKEGGQQALTEVCLNQEGVIFSMLTKTKGFSMTIEAKSFSTNVQPDAFVMPILSTVPVKTLPTTPASETENWKTHQIEEYGVQLRYPMEWKVEQEREGEWGSFLPAYEAIIVSSDFRVVGQTELPDYYLAPIKTGGRLHIELVFNRVKPYSYEEFWEVWTKYLQSYESIREINNLKFRYSHYYSEREGSASTIFSAKFFYPFYPQNNYVFSITLEAPKSEEALYERIFNDVLSSFSFKKISNISASSLRKVNITVTSNPLGADVYLDDKFVGKAPFTKQMPTGIYLVRCVLDGYADSYTSVGVTEAGADAGVIGAGATCQMRRTFP